MTWIISITVNQLLWYSLSNQFYIKGIVLKKNYIMDENNSLSEYNKIPLGHNRTNGAVYSKIYFKVEICSALHVRYSIVIPRFISRANTAQSS